MSAAFFSVLSSLSKFFEGLLFPFTPSFWQTWWHVVLGSNIFLIGGRFALIRGLHLRPEDRKERAYALSVLSSSALFVSSIPVVYGFFKVWIANGYDGGYDYILRTTPLSGTMMVAFLNYLVLDTVDGVVIHKGHFDILTGWLHHSLYYFAVTNALKWNATVGISAMFIEELPTALLGLGTMNSKWRTEEGFGFTFFVTRILFHSFAVLFCACDSSLYPMELMAAFTWAIHLYWFYGWIQRQLRIRKRRRADKPDYDSQEAGVPLHDETHPLLSQDHPDKFLSPSEGTSSATTRLSEREEDHDMTDVTTRTTPSEGSTMALVSPFRSPSQ